ncbi:MULTISPECIES: hypothetical protein [Bradyrhizobium]|nr:MULTISPECIES: hypothetical protein [Bradyrhizobium]KMJ95029.1 hypothetical protein CF64_34020 [Bradyrhizobium japonicum]MCS3537060.1 hypothetical protein [Bradyrhizobium japonicum]MCS3986883.1 hypothetical protein [Bradyrhizobium japonicum]MCS4018301.1 hypothetical protein [Bradyrhizobium japonicum]MCS4205438.1 hypothetical protein [Bradyrhizobium japonicum]
MGLEAAKDWARSQKQLALSELDAARRANDANAIEEAANRLIHLSQFTVALSGEAPDASDGKLGPGGWFLLIGIACALVALLLSIHPTAGLISMEASSRGVRLAFEKDVRLKGEGLAFVGYDITEISGAAAVTDARGGATLPLNVKNERLKIEADAAIAEIHVAKDDELSVELFGSDLMRLSLHGPGSGIDLSLNGTAVRLLDGDGKPLQAGALTAKRNVHFQSGPALEVLLTRRPKAGERLSVIQYSGQMGLIAFDKRVPVNGILNGRSNLLQSATVAFLGFGDEKTSPFGGQALSVIRGNGAFELSATATTLNVAFNGNAVDVRGTQSTLTPSLLHWLWKNTTITFTFGAIISVLGFLLTSRTRIREFLNKG